MCVSPPEEGEYFLKVLIPSYAAGSIIGKGGQTIVQLQKETGATIKLSKSKDFYPGKNKHLIIKIDEHKGEYMRGVVWLITHLEERCFAAREHLIFPLHLASHQ